MNPSENINKQISDLTDWRGEMYSRLRKIINQSDTELKEEFKWGTAVWSKNGLVCAIGVFKNHVKINFFKGKELADPNKLFNTTTDAKAMRSIDFHENYSINEPALKELIRSAVDLNTKKL